MSVKEESSEYFDNMMTLFRTLKFGPKLFGLKYKIQSSYREQLAHQISQEEVKKQVTDNLTRHMAELIIAAYDSEIIEKEETFNTSVYSLDLIVISPNELKTLVEAAIQVIPTDVLKKLRHE